MRVRSSPFFIFSPLCSFSRFSSVTTVLVQRSTQVRTRTGPGRAILTTAVGAVMSPQALVIHP